MNNTRTPKQQSHERNPPILDNGVCAGIKIPQQYSTFINQFQPPDQPKNKPQQYDMMPAKGMTNPNEHQTKK
jgi:hypothetical protein